MNSNDMPSKTLRVEKLDLRLTRKAEIALRAAAAVSHRSVSESVLESVLARADEALADRRTFGLNPAEWKAFLAAQDAPPRALPRLKCFFFVCGAKAAPSYRTPNFYGCAIWSSGTMVRSGIGKVDSVDK
jgi:uncharacterized protein (DUF1778 family)